MQRHGPSHRSSPRTRWLSNVASTCRSEVHFQKPPKAKQLGPVEEQGFLLVKQRVLCVTQAQKAILAELWATRPSDPCSLVEHTPNQDGTVLTEQWFCFLCVQSSEPSRTLLGTRWRSMPSSNLQLSSQASAPSYCSRLLLKRCSLKTGPAPRDPCLQGKRSLEKPDLPLLRSTGCVRELHQSCGSHGVSLPTAAVSFGG